MAVSGALAIDHDKFKNEIRKRILSGKGLINSFQRSQDWLDEFNKWNRYNQELLKRRFTDEEYLDEYNLSHHFAWPSVDTYEEERDNLNREVTTLESFYERVELIPLDKDPVDLIVGGAALGGAALLLYGYGKKQGIKEGKRAVQIDAQNIPKKYQIFVSSTFEDLKEERASLFKALHEAGHILVEMEYFLASDKCPTDYINNVLDSCDYLVLVIKGRYGTIGPSGMGYTEQEFDYAITKKIPTLPFILKTIPLDDDPRDEEKLRLFKSKIKEHKMCKECAVTELNATVISSLNKAIMDTPRPGLIRGDIFDEPRQ
jgi:hypothetical protein